jgi:putative ABC transport system permease protein
MNIMLVSITQRRREIGIRLAVGAKQADICILFLLEAVILSLSGGILGIIFGVLIAYLVAYYWHWDFMLFWQPIILGFFVSVMVGIFFGFYPAYRAAKLDPIIALHH